MGTATRYSKPGKQPRQTTKSDLTQTRGQQSSDGTAIPDLPYQILHNTSLARNSLPVSSHPDELLSIQILHRPIPLARIIRIPPSPCPSHPSPTKVPTIVYLIPQTPPTTYPITPRTTIQRPVTSREKVAEATTETAWDVSVRLLRRIEFGGGENGYRRNCRFCCYGCGTGWERTCPVRLDRPSWVRGGGGSRSWTFDGVVRCKGERSGWIRFEAAAEGWPGSGLGWRCDHGVEANEDPKAFAVAMEFYGMMGSRMVAVHPWCYFHSDDRLFAELLVNILLSWPVDGCVPCT